MLPMDGETMGSIALQTPLIGLAKEAFLGAGIKQRIRRSVETGSKLHSQGPRTPPKKMDLKTNAKSPKFPRSATKMQLANDLSASRQLAGNFLAGTRHATCRRLGIWSLPSVGKSMTCKSYLTVDQIAKSRARVTRPIPGHRSNCRILTPPRTPDPSSNRSGSFERRPSLKKSSD